MKLEILWADLDTAGAQSLALLGPTQFASPRLLIRFTTLKYYESISGHCQKSWLKCSAMWRRRTGRWSTAPHTATDDMGGGGASFTLRSLYFARLGTVRRVPFLTPGIEPRFWRMVSSGLLRRENLKSNPDSSIVQPIAEFQNQPGCPISLRG
jgi:hypothetical protein